MNGILSQEEVDALLQAVASGTMELPGAQVEDDAAAQAPDYSFRRQHMLPRDRLRILQTLHERYAEELKSRLSLSLRTSAEIRLVSVEQPHFRDFVLDLPDVTHMQVLRMESPAAQVVLEIGLPFIAALIDVLLGGSGRIQLEHRPLTEVELAIAKPTLATFVQELERCLGHVAPCTLTRTAVEDCPEYVQAMPADTPTMVLTFEARIGEGSGVINLCYPVSFVEAFIAQVDRQGVEAMLLSGAEQVGDGGCEAMQDAIQSVPLRLAALLGRARISLGEMMSLKPGDTIVLGTRITAPIHLELEERPFFTGQPAVYRRRLAVRLKQLNLPD